MSQQNQQLKKPVKRQRASSSNFAERVRAVVAKIPKGETLTYKQVAEAAGSPNAARAVGTVMSKNFDPAIPCHRVVRSDGTPGGYNRGGSEKKQALLAQEKINSYSVRNGMQAPTPLNLNARSQRLRASSSFNRLQISLLRRIETKYFHKAAICFCLKFCKK